MAVEDDHQGAALAVDRHARRQPGADRSDGRREEAPLLRAAVQGRHQGDRVGFPSAGATEFDFISGLVQNDKIPDDVIVQVLTQSRQDLIETSFESLKGAKKAIVHLYNAVSPAWRRIVFGMSGEEIKGIAIAGAKVLRDEAAKQPDTDWHFEYSPRPSPPPSSISRSRSARR
jgi:hypothetical protein